jgi:hypothetical protein
MDLGASGFGYVNPQVAHIICEREGIAPIKLLRPRRGEAYDGRVGHKMTHAIYPQVRIQDHVAMCPLLITPLHRPMIIGRTWMRNHGILLNMIDNKVIFKEGHCGSGCFPDIRKRKVTVQPAAATGPVTDRERAGNPQSPEPKPQRILKRTDQDAGLSQSLATHIPHPQANKPIEVNMVGAAPFRTLAHQKDAQVFAVSMRDILDEESRRQKQLTDDEIRERLPTEYQDLAEVFSKSAADELPPHRASDHKIKLKDGADPEAAIGPAPLYRMSDQELDACKRYIDEHLSKGFIRASSAP